MRTELLNYEGSVLEDLINCEENRALILVPWLGAPEHLITKELKSRKKIVDLTRGLIRSSIPRKGESGYFNPGNTFHPDNSGRIFIVNMSKLPFLGIRRVLSFFHTLGFRQEEVSVLFMTKSYEEASNENSMNKQKYAEMSIMENHVFLANQLFEYCFGETDHVHGTPDEMTRNADVIIADNRFACEIVEQNGEFIQRISPRNYQIIPIKRSGKIFPLKPLINSILALTKTGSPYTLDNDLYSLNYNRNGAEEFFDKLDKFTEARKEDGRLMDENERWLQRTEEEKRFYKAEQMRARIDLQKAIRELPVRFPLDQDKVFDLGDFFRDEW